MKKKFVLAALLTFLFCCGFSFQNTDTGYIKKDIKLHGIIWKKDTKVYITDRDEKSAVVYYMGATYELPLKIIASLEEIRAEQVSPEKSEKKVTVCLTIKKDTKVYIQPDISQKVIGTLKEGQPAIAMGNPVKGWIQIYYIGMIGYIPENTAEFYIISQALLSEKMSLQDGMKINVLGDSISYGDGLEDRSKAYPYVLATKTGAARLNNYSICGTCITGSVPYRFMERYPEMERDAALILVFGGTNDYGVLKGTALGNFGDATEETFYGSLNLMMCGLKQMYPDSQIVFMTPLRRAGDENRNAKGYTLSQYAFAIQEMGDFWGIKVIDIFHTQELNFCAKPSYLIDGLHPNEAGHALLGNFLYQELFEKQKIRNLKSADTCQMAD